MMGKKDGCYFGTVLNKVGKPISSFYYLPKEKYLVFRARDGYQMMLFIK